MFSLDKLFSRHSLIGVGAAASGLFLYVFHGETSGALFKKNSGQKSQLERIEQDTLSVIFPVQANGTVRYFTVDQFARTAAKLASLELPLKSSNLDGLTTTAAFSEGNILHLRSVLDERLSVSKSDLTVLEILTAIDYCADPAMKMFFDYSGQVIERVFSNEGMLVKQIVFHHEVCEQDITMRERP